MKAPITLEIIIHYYCTAGSTDYSDSPAFRKEAKMLVRAGLLIETRKEKPKFEPNIEAIKVYLDALLNVPFPKLVWIIPKQEINNL